MSFQLGGDVSQRNALPNPQAHYSFQKRPPLDHLLSQINPVYILSYIMFQQITL